MPEFVMNGKEHPDFEALDTFTQGYIEAAFFTQSGDAEDGGTVGDLGFTDLAPETLQSMIEDCREFQKTEAWKLTDEALDSGEAVGPHTGDMQAGHDFWFTRNGHGCGFWDGDWPEPYASKLTEAAKEFGEVSLYVGDDGKIYA